VTRVLIGASSELVRAGLASLLTADRMFQVVGTFSIDNALTRFEDLQPDVVLLDLESPTDESMSAAIESGDVAVRSGLVILTGHPEHLAARLLSSGARAILPRDATPEEIVAAIQAAATGLVALPSDVFDSMLSRIRPGQQIELDPSDQILTPREIEVLRMIAEGLGNKEIASKLGISDHTVKFHISSIFAKLGASNRAEAVTIGIRQGLIMV
jgi:two-component system, NarL family, response regulator YdfI